MQAGAMILFENEIYHIYNRGNNRQQIFFKEEHYFWFLFLMRKHIMRSADLLAWCLMPNHFHLLIRANAGTIKYIIDGSFGRQAFSQGIKNVLSSYTKRINREMRFTGSRFQQHTKSKNVSSPLIHAWTAFHYIHQNPLRAGLVSRMEDWEYSSFREYLGRAALPLCDRKLARELLDLDMWTLYRDSYAAIDEDRKVQIFKP